MDRRVDREQLHLDLTGLPHLELLHALEAVRARDLAVLRRAQVEQEADRHGEDVPERGEDREGGGEDGAGGRGGGRGRAWAFDEGGVWGGDGLGGEREVVELCLREEAHEVQEGSAEEDDRHSLSL